ncbi:hypothetical protein [Fluviicola taffensis]|uniref:hypothetical protein n=1 Tax=Fluviicola taffensis TaxID=191579 RepID=UPI003137F8D1
MYYYYRAKLMHCLITASLALFSTTSFGQTQATVDSLRSVRSQLISSNQSTTDVDLLLHQSGNNPTCIIHQSDDYTFTFVPYQPLGNEQREQKMNLRLKAHYTYLNVIDFSDDFTSVRITCNEQLTPAIINELIIHFGYNGYETH